MKWRFSFLVFAAVSLGYSCPGQEANLQSLTRSVTDPSSEVVTARKIVEDSLTDETPAAKIVVSHFLTKDGRYVLHGDLFHNGTNYALVEIGVRDTSNDLPRSNGDFVGLARWEAKRWVLCGLWEISTTWRPKGWKESGADYLPTTPAEKPFELKDLSGDSTPEVVIAGEVDKYFQRHYLLRFDPKAKNLRLVATSMAEPRFAGGYVVLYNKSPRRAIWEESTYLKWNGLDLVAEASWHEETPYNTDAPSFAQATRRVTGGKMTSYQLDTAESSSEKRSDYVVTRDEKPFAKVTIKWRNALDADSDSIEKSYLFRKLTGLPGSLFPRDGEKAATKVLEKLAEIQVTGEADARSLFSGKRPWFPFPLRK